MSEGRQNFTPEQELAKHLIKAAVAELSQGERTEFNAVMIELGIILERSGAAGVLALYLTGINLGQSALNTAMGGGKGDQGQPSPS